MTYTNYFNWFLILTITLLLALIGVIEAKTTQNKSSVNSANDSIKSDDTRRQVKKCTENCPKECPGTIVVGIASARLLRGCKVVRGNLEIAIREECENVVRELEENLKDIEIVDGYLKILRSHPLTSLNFLKNLTEIRGNDLGYKDYSLLIVDNLNLKELWNRTDRAHVKIGSKNGDPKVLFVYNPKLCLEMIEELTAQSGLKRFSKDDVSFKTNGDHVTCKPRKKDR